MTEVHIVTTAPESYKALVWEVFFASRRRGIDLLTHFPWFSSVATNRWYVVATDGDTVVGGLCVHETSEIPRIASVGLVCVHPAYRGKGLSSRLLTRVLSEAKFRHLAALQLWTNKPEIYRKHGFVQADISLFGWIRGPVDRSRNSRAPIAESLIGQQPNSLIGLPPFAQSGRHWQSDDASATVIEDEIGPIIAEWTGAADEVASLLEQVLPEAARFNGQLGDDLITTLNMRGWHCMLTETKLQMICPITEDKSPVEWALQRTPRILHRI